MVSTDTRCNSEYKKEKDPGNVLEPAESQENAQVVPNEGGNVHQLRTLSPQKDTYPSRRSSTVSLEHRGLHVLTKREITEMITIPTLPKSVRSDS